MPPCRTGEGHRRSQTGLPPQPSEAGAVGRRRSKGAERTFARKGERKRANLTLTRKSSNSYTKIAVTKVAAVFLVGQSEFHRAPAANQRPQGVFAVEVYLSENDGLKNFFAYQ